MQHGKRRGKRKHHLPRTGLLATLRHDAALRGRSLAMTLDLAAEWLEADGHGDFASGTVGGARSRRYHALLLVATMPPAGRMVLVNGIEAWVEQKSGTAFLSAQTYAPGVTTPASGIGLDDFQPFPHPAWRFRLPGGGTIAQEISVVRGGGVVLRWRADGAAGRLHIRPLLSGRDYHALHRQNDMFDFTPHAEGDNLTWRPYPGVPAIVGGGNFEYRHAPEWYRNFLYEEEKARGLDCLEDLAAPGVFSRDLASGEAMLAFGADTPVALAPVPETAREKMYFVGRGGGRSVLAGFPWFTDWGRDSFIALRGLAIATGRLAEAEAVLLGWAGAVSEGMLPNRFPDSGGAAEYNSVDASLWFVVAVQDFLAAADPGAAVRDRLRGAVEAIVAGYARGTRFRIGMDADGLLAAGVPGQQLTWMDAKIGDEVVTPRIGKPVEVQALWINALRIAAAWTPHWSEVAERALAAFRARFPAPDGGLADVIDCDHQPGTRDDRLRPNQIFTVGGLPIPLLEGEAARRVVDHVEAALLTPLGLRTLAPDDPGYVPQYRGGPAERDRAYHQGTAWPWLLGPFIEAWLRVRGADAAAKAEARARFLPPLHAHLRAAGLGHVSEIVDGDAPHRPAGCPFQAWSLGELIRIERLLA